MRITARAPCRIDLAGGTLDIYPLSLLIQGGRTVNLALSLACSAELIVGGEHFVLTSSDGQVTLTADHIGDLAPTGPLGPIVAIVKYFAPLLPAVPFHLTTHSEVPHGSGLGASSALLLAVGATLNAFSLQPRAVGELIALTTELEAQALGAPAGCQDQYAAAFGGLAVIHTGVGGTRRESVDLTPDEMAVLAQWLVLTWSGEPHHSADINWEVFKGWVDGRGETVAALQEIKGTAIAMAAAVRRRDWPTMAALLGKEWQARRSRAPGIATPTLGRLAAAAAAAGAIASKGCGAGGGGCLVTVVPPARREAVVAALTAVGGRVLPLAPAARGLQVDMM